MGASGLYQTPVRSRGLFCRIRAPCSKLTRQRKRAAQNLRMPDYRLVLDNGSEREDLGRMALADDAEAIVFGSQVIRDLKPEAGRYEGWSMDITEGDLIVGTIPFEL